MEDSFIITWKDLMQSSHAHNIQSTVVQYKKILYLEQTIVHGKAQVVHTC